MAMPKHDYIAATNVPAGSRFRLVQDGDIPVQSPALALQRTLAQATGHSTDPYERYPLAFRLIFLVVASFGLWTAIVRSM